MCGRVQSSKGTIYAKKRKKNAFVKDERCVGKQWLYSMSAHTQCTHSQSCIFLSFFIYYTRRVATYNNAVCAAQLTLMAYVRFIVICRQRHNDGGFSSSSSTFLELVYVARREHGNPVSSNWSNIKNGSRPPTNYRRVIYSIPFPFLSFWFGVGAAANEAAVAAMCHTFTA